MGGGGGGGGGNTTWVSVWGGGRVRGGGGEDGDGPSVSILTAFYVSAPPISDVGSQNSHRS